MIVEERIRLNRQLNLPKPKLAVLMIVGGFLMVMGLLMLGIVTLGEYKEQHAGYIEISGRNESIRAWIPFFLGGFSTLSGAFAGIQVVRYLTLQRKQKVIEDSLAT